MRKNLIVFATVISVFFVWTNSSYAFWIWTPKSKTMVNPKFAVKDTPREQYDWAMSFFQQKDFKRAAEEFVRFIKFYSDSEQAPEAQYYAGRAYEEAGKYYFAFQNYQKTIDNYPYTQRMDEIIKREYNIANIFQSKESAKLMELELSISLDRAVEVYKKIVDNNPFGKLAERSLFKMAECYRRMFRYTEAIEAYEKIINDYPESRLVPEAKYQLAYTRYDASLNPEYDQESTEEALKEFKEISTSSPVPSVANDAEKVLSELRNKKADSVFNVATFYERQGKYRSAVIYYRDVTSKFPDTQAAQKAREKISKLEKKIKD
ncbi:MAG: outer membrane protein assembly factor BamD [Candidatus Omnitrophica bacterium]|nr:outer membrane protein assembly factor BamD [Candidatus Omnitrophota bacterium]